VNAKSWWQTTTTCVRWATAWACSSGRRGRRHRGSNPASGAEPQPDRGSCVRCMAGAATPRTSAMHASEVAILRGRSAARSLRRPGRISRRRTRLQLAHNQNLTGNALRAPVVFLHMYMCFPTMVRLPWPTCNRSASCVDAFTQSTAIVNKTRQCDFTDGQARLWSRPWHCPVSSLNQPLSWSARPRNQKSRRHRRRHRPRRLSGVRLHQVVQVSPPAGSGHSI